MATETTVKLSSKHETDREFSITHAQDLLALEKKMGVNNWELTDKNFTLNENGNIERRDTGAAKASGSAKPNSESK